MKINIIDYRGPEDSMLFQKRTIKFLQVQQDFARWQAHGHEFTCWTQHTDLSNFMCFDHVRPIPRCSAAMARNHVLDASVKDSWIGIWDNDATLYWSKGLSAEFPSKVKHVIELADAQDLYGFVPHDPRQSPYPIKNDVWHFRSTNIFKGSMCFLRVSDIRYDQSMTALEDVDYACQQTMLKRKMARLEQISLNEVASSTSTIFDHTNRRELYAKNKQILASKYKHIFKTDRLGPNNKFIIKRLGELQRSYWNNTTIPALQNHKFAELFE